MGQPIGQDSASALAWRERWCFDVGSATSRIALGPQQCVISSQVVVDEQSGDILPAHSTAFSSLKARHVGKAKVVFPVYKGRFTSDVIAVQWLQNLKTQLVTSRWQKWLPTWQTAVVAVPTQAFPSDLEVLTHLFHKAGWPVTRLVTKAEAYAAVLSQGKGEVTGLVIDIGADTTELAVLAQGRVVTAMTWYQGSAELTLAITKMLRRTYNLEARWESAEHIKHQLVGLWPVPLAGKLQNRQLPFQGIDVQTGESNTVPILAKHLHSYYQGWYQELLEKVRKISTPALESNQSRLSIPTIWLTGGGSQLPGLSQSLEVDTGIAIQVLPLPQLTVLRGLERV